MGKALTLTFYVLYLYYLSYKYTYIDVAWYMMMRILIHIVFVPFNRDNEKWEELWQADDNESSHVNWSIREAVKNLALLGALSSKRGGGFPNLDQKLHKTFTSAMSFWIRPLRMKIVVCATAFFGKAYRTIFQSKRRRIVFKTGVIMYIQNDKFPENI